MINSRILIPLLPEWDSRGVQIPPILGTLHISITSTRICRKLRYDVPEVALACIVRDAVSHWSVTYMPCHYFLQTYNLPEQIIKATAIVL